VGKKYLYSKEEVVINPKKNKNKMKNVNDLMILLNKAVESNSEKKTWFFSFSGHVNLIEVRLYPKGWICHSELEELGLKPEYSVKGAYLENKDSIQELFYWVKFKLENEL